MYKTKNIQEKQEKPKKIQENQEKSKKTQEKAKDKKNPLVVQESVVGARYSWNVNPLAQPKSTVINNIFTPISSLGSREMSTELFSTIDIETIGIDALVDSGAVLSLLHARHLPLLEAANIQIHRDCGTIRGITGSHLPVRGVADVPFKFGGRAFRWPLLIIDKIPYDAVLGKDFMRRYGCVLDLELLQMSSYRFPNWLASIVEKSASACQVSTMVPIPRRQLPVRWTSVMIDHRDDAKQKKFLTPGETALVRCRLSPHFWDTLGTRREVDVIVRPLFTPSPRSHFLVPFMLAKVIRGQDRIIVEVRNGGTSRWVVRPRACIAEVLPIDTDADYHVMALRPDTADLDYDGMEAPPDEFVRQFEESMPTAVKPATRIKLMKILWRHKSVFSNTLGRTTKVKCTINTGDAAPIAQPPRQMNTKRRVQFADALEQQIKDGIVEPSISPWASPVVLVPKKDGSIRVCVDYRRLNNATVKDVYPLPSIDNMLASLDGAKVFTSFDLNSGFNQIVLDPEDRVKTAFTSPIGLYQYTRMPMGIVNGPSVFQRLMDTVLAGLKWIRCLVYIDDIIIFSGDHDQHLKDIAMVLERLEEAGLTVKNVKCRFFYEQLAFLGHVVSQEGISPDPSRVEAIQHLTAPTDVKTLLSFLGITGYYRRFIHRYAEIASPMYKLVRKDVEWTWNDDCGKAFKVLKRALVTAPILRNPDFTHAFHVITDASGYGLSGVLAQRIPNANGELLEYVIAYISRTLSEYEAKWHIRELECLAIIWSLRKFRPFIEGCEITVVTDHESLRWLANLEDPTGRLGRWVMEIQHLNLKIEHRPGRKHQNADTPSRDPLPANPEEFERPFNALALVAQPEWIEEFGRLQAADAFCKKMRAVIEDQDVDWASEEEEKRFVGWKKHFSVKKELLYHVGLPVSKWLEVHGAGEALWRLVVPSVLRKTVLEKYHSATTAGHPGQSKTLLAVRSRFFWPRMKADVISFVRGCTTCQLVKAPVRQPFGLHEGATNPGSPMDIVTMDLMGPYTATRSGNKYVCVFMDLFSRWVEIKAIPSKRYKYVADNFVSQIVCRYGVPRAIISDNGTEFVNKVAKYLAETLDFDHRSISPYNPKANPTERVNREVKKMIRAVTASRANWDEHLDEYAFALRTTPNESTGFSPAQVLFGFSPRFPQDVVFTELVSGGLPTELRNCDQDLRRYAFRLRRRLKKIYEIQQRNKLDARARQKVYFDRRRLVKSFKIGDLVWIRNTVPSSSKKKISASLEPIYVPQVYRVVEVVSPVSYRLENVVDGQDVVSRHVQDLRDYVPPFDLDRLHEGVDNVLEERPEPAFVEFENLADEEQDEFREAQHYDVPVYSEDDDLPSDQESIASEALGDPFNIGDNMPVTIRGDETRTSKQVLPSKNEVKRMDIGGANKQTRRKQPNPQSMKGTSASGAPRGFSRSHAPHQ